MSIVRLEDTRTGETLGGRYLLGALVGRGGHGEVYRARDIIDQRDVAIKCLAPHLAQDNDYRLRLVREARAIAALEGLGTIEIMGVVGADDGTPCLVMELLEGFDLSDAIGERYDHGRRFEVAEVVTIFGPVVRTLDAAHARGIVHRDIKPSNIYLVGGKLGDARIMDFGLAKLGDLASITADHMLAGSPSYIAPELWKFGAKAADARSDVYSLTCVIYQSFTGDVPLWRENITDMLIAVTTPHEVPSLHKQRPDLPRSTDDWLAQALAIDPRERFQTVAALWRALRSTIDDG